MALTVAPAANADSYVSVSDADAYLAGRGVGTVWTALTTVDKENALRLATEYIDAHFSARFIGSRTASDQSLAWPRAEVFVHGATVSLDDESIPTALQRATALIAVESRSVDLSANLGAAVKREKIGPIETEYVTAASGSADRLIQFPFVEKLLSVYLGGGIGQLLTRRA